MICATLLVRAECAAQRGNIFCPHLHHGCKRQLEVLERIGPQLHLMLLMAILGNCIPELALELAEPNAKKRWVAGPSGLSSSPVTSMASVVGSLHRARPNTTTLLALA